MSAHTPGPWAAEPFAGSMTVWGGKKLAVNVASVNSSDDEADARLIAAAPTLLAAACAVLDAYGPGMASLPIGSPKREALRLLRDARDAAVEATGAAS